MSKSELAGLVPLIPYAVGGALILSALGAGGLALGGLGVKSLLRQRELEGQLEESYTRQYEANRDITQLMDVYTQESYNNMVMEGGVEFIGSTGQAITDIEQEGDITRLTTVDDTVYQATIIGSPTGGTQLISSDPEEFELRSDQLQSWAFLQSLSFEELKTKYPDMAQAVVGYGYDWEYMRTLPLGFVQDRYPGFYEDLAGWFDWALPEWWAQKMAFL